MAIPVKLTRAHQVTLPKRFLEQAGWVDQEYFLADLRGGALVLTPIRLSGHAPITSFAELRRHFARIGITRREITEAVSWARQHVGSAPKPRRAKR